MEIYHQIGIFSISGMRLKFGYFQFGMATLVDDFYMLHMMVEFIQQGAVFRKFEKKIFFCLIELFQVSEIFRVRNSFQESFIIGIP